MPTKIITTALLVSSAIFSVLIGYYSFENILGALSFGCVGLVAGVACLRLLRLWINTDIHNIIGGVVGTLIGAILGIIIYSGISQNIEKPEVAGAVYGLVMALFCLVGLQLGSYKAKDLKNIKAHGARVNNQTSCILDTSVIIDGRIADVCETGFIGGELIIPQFVLKELQLIADSQDSTKRTRGRRGLDILSKIQKQSCVGIKIDDTDYPAVKEVDQKLITMAKETGFSLLTNDFNLNKVAEVHSIQVLNMNQLANALKPVVLPGETMKVQIIKEGKEPSQGVAYLDDGTMVVIDQGKKFIGKTVDATVTSVLQTTAGRMIFATAKN